MLGEENAEGQGDVTDLNAKQLEENDATNNNTDEASDTEEASDSTEISP